MRLSVHEAELRRLLDSGVRRMTPEVMTIALGRTGWVPACAGTTKG